MRVAAALLLSALVVLLGAVPAVAGEVRLDASGADPRRLEVAPGESVVWTNDGEEPVILEGRNQPWSSGPIRPGTTFSLAFDDPGTHRYTVAGTGQGGVIVVGGGDAGDGNGNGDGNGRARGNGAANGRGNGNGKAGGGRGGEDADEEGQPAVHVSGGNLAETGADRSVTGTGGGLLAAGGLALLLGEWGRRRPVRG